MSEQVLRNGNAMARSKTRTITQIAMLGAIAGILMNLEFPLPFLAPTFYQLDFSEIPVLVGSFAMGPIAGVLIELVKILVHLVTKGSMTAGVGDVANFIFGCTFAVPAGLIYRYHKTRKQAIIGMATGTVSMAVIGGLLNAFVLLPAYAALFGGMDAIIGMGTAVNKNITGLQSFVLLSVVPFNLVKGVVVSLVTFLLYKHVSRILIHQA